MSEIDEHNAIFEYGDPKIASDHQKVPKWVIWMYAIVFFHGVIWAVLFWNGNMGWLDRGYWHQLQKAANTTIPFENLNYPEYDHSKK